MASANQISLRYIPWIRSRAGAAMPLRSFYGPVWSLAAATTGASILFVAALAMLVHR
jgi:hypothetical protein